MRKLPAFTLVEILVVVAILGIISLAAATPLIQSGNGILASVAGGRRLLK